MKSKCPEFTNTHGVKDFKQADFILEKYEEYLDTINQDVTPTPPEIDSDGKLILKQGDLFHGRSSNETTIKKIADRGIESGQLHGTAEDGETYWCADFFKVPKDGMTSDEICKLGGQYTNGSNKIVYVINKEDITGSAALFPNLSTYNAYDENTKGGQITREIVNTKALPLNSNTGASFLIGLPASLISSIIINEEIEQDLERLDLLNELFPKAYIFSRTNGILLRYPKTMHKKI